MAESLGFVLISNQRQPREPLGIQVLGAIGAIIGPTGSLSEICRLQQEPRTFRCIEEVLEKLGQASTSSGSGKCFIAPVKSPHLAIDS